MKFYLFFFLTAAAVLTANDKPNHCQWNESCTIEVPNSMCADGKSSFVRATFRENAENMMIFLNGGGACWDAKSCGCDGHGTCSGRTASPLGRPSPNDYGNWFNGSGFRDSQNGKNPIDQSYTIFEMPYCTGDAYAGNATAFYGAQDKVEHKGYVSTQATIKTIQSLVTSPKKLLFMGCSAGGLGVAYNAHQVAKSFPTSSLYVVSDAGTPFKSPHVKSSRIDGAFKSWNVASTWPGASAGADGVLDMSDIWRWNGQTFPDAKFALISSYNDKVMTGFALMLGSMNPMHVVENMITDVARNDFQANTHGFYIESTQHCFYQSNPSDVQTNNVSLASWVSDMLSDSSTWQNQMPR